MSEKDRRILSLDGGRYPYNVSDEYFDHLTARIMKQIPEEDASEKNTVVVDINKNRRRNLWLRTASIAASLLIVAAIALKFIPLSTSTTPPEALTAEYTDDDYNEDLMAYAMADNMTVYDYLSGSTEE